MADNGEKDWKTALKVAISANLGWGFELFDLVVYLYVATTIAPLFFPSSSKIASLLLFLLTIVIGYFARPLGGIFFGHYGDRIGRKRLWFVSLAGMGIATVSIGFLPTYYQIGILATVLIILLRIVQGFFLAGEWGGGMTLVNEFSPPNLRGLMSGIQQGGAALGLIFAVIANEVALALAPGDAFQTYGWRIMFWFGVVPLAIALAIRWKVGESVEWLNKVANNPEKIPIATVFKKWWKLVIIATIVLFSSGSIYYGIIAYMPTFLGLYTRLSAYQIDNVVLATNLIWLFVSPLTGYLSDVLKVRKLLIAILGFVIGALVYPIIILLATGSYVLSIIAGLVLGFLFAFQYSIFPAWLSENITTNVRYSYIAFSINLGVALSSFAPYIVTFLGLVFSNPVTGIAVFDIITSILGGVVALMSPRDRVGLELH
ncbi:MFS transporter [Sulfurisphaera tokodaii]|uniref:MFS transporter n=2 Tax=Sulfurisphaera tokodaii TaxID=111955 RepID=Q96XE1_SULTO|nr:MFS transporter [Sulfurisphaera tokodaii]BAB67687.1 putative MFS transporter [Sulfurisphaera tokodaii str. 7]HII73777.1 MHS family MFS transporter [Sulfurisphaera tokodaii]